MSSLVPVGPSMPGGGSLVSARSEYSTYGHIVVIWDYAALDKLLNQREGTVGKDLEARADRVKWAAKAQAGMGTGALKLSIHTDHRRTSHGQAFAIGSPLSYALLHHEGSKPHVIIPKHGGSLVFSKGAQIVFADEVINPGTKPNRYLTDNLYLAVVSSNLPAAL